MSHGTGGGGSVPHSLGRGGPGHRSFSGGGWWGILLPIAILVVLFAVISRAPSEPGSNTPTAASAVFVPVFEHLPLTSQGHYALWVVHPDGGEERLAAFAVGPGGALFTLNSEPVQEFPILELPPPGSTLLVTVEAGSDPASARSPRVLLRGALTSTDVRFEPVVPSVPDGQSAFLLAPTDTRAPGTTGLWFAKQTAARGKPAAGLQLPPPGEGWAYGGFITTAAGTSLPTGLFPDPTTPDHSAPYSGPKKGLAFPGEDFVANPPEGTVFPINLADGRSTVTVSLEPDFATGIAPPLLPLLTARIPFRQEAGKAFPLQAVPDEEFPKGSGSFQQQVPE